MDSKKAFVYTLIFLLSFTSIIGLFSSVQAETWTDITLPYTIMESGNYRIIQACDSPGTILSINASNIVVDGQDNLIQSTQSEDDYAISIAPSCTNILLKNFNVTGSDYGVYAIETGNITVEESTFTNNTAAALFGYNVTDFAVQHSQLSNNSNGFVAIDSSRLTINDSHFKNNTFGIEVVQSNNITLQACYLNNNTYALTAISCTNLAARDSIIIENDDAIETYYTTSTIDNLKVSDNYNVAIHCQYGNLTATNFEAKNNSIGIYAVAGNLTISYASLKENTAGIFSVANNLTTVSDCALEDNLVYGVVSMLCNSTIIDDCSLNNNTYGVMALENQKFVLKNSIIANNSVGLEEFLGNNTLVTGNLFSQNGFIYDDFFGGGIMAEDTNCTVTDNAFTNNFDALMFGVYSNQTQNTQTYHYNSFINNSFTFDFNYRLTSDFTNQQIYFYNNLVNDSSYVNPESFSSTYELLVPPNTVLHLNTTFQPGTRVTLDGGRMIGGNYWAHPNGTGFSQTVTDADTDGFADQPFDFLGNGTVYDYLPYSSDFVEKVVSLTISPQDAAIAAGQSVNYTTTAYDQYGNAWNASAQYSIDGQSFIGSSLIGYVPGMYNILASYGGKTVQTTLTVTTGPVTRFLIQAPQTATADTPFTVSVAALDPVGNIASSFTGTVTLSANGAAVTPATSGAFTSGMWAGTVSIPQAGTFTLNVTDGNGHTGMSNTITVSSATEPTPTPTPTPTTIQATKEDGSKVSLTITGNITSSQISNLTITTNQTAQTTILSFTVTGETQTTGFTNMTIPKSQIPYGTTPTVMIDGKAAASQGYTEDSQNFYVWFTTSFSTHQIVISFEQTSPNPTGTTDPLTPILITIAVIAAIAATVVLVKRKRSKW